jgi:glycerol-3-phosphate dehydrogenase
MDRKSFIEELRGKSDQTWDIIVIGGGATGLGIALDSVSRGYSTLLLERSDFASATSSRSTKLVHGGVRYMAQGDLLLVMEALRERGIMLRNAPHLTSNQEFVIPVYTISDVILYTVGLKFYDLLAGRLSLGRSYFIGREKTLKRIPALVPAKLKGGVVYHDGQFDDSRMALALAEACAARGGVLLNYFEVTGFIKNADQRISGVQAVDTISGEQLRMKGKLVINAAGVFADSIHKLDNPGSKATIKPSQGVHIVLDRSFLDSDSAIMIPKTDDGRVLFAIPWHDRVVVGTTDTPLELISREPKALDSEINFILDTAGRYLSVPPHRKDVLSIFAGLRPLAADPDNPHATKEVSRRHKISFADSGLLTIIGGKWTTYRRMAEETIDSAIRAGVLEKRSCVTRDLKLTKASSRINGSRLRIYGERASEIEELNKKDPSAAEPLHPALPYSKAEIIWICRNEMPVTLEDLLARRTRALFLDARASSAIAPLAAKIMAGEMDHGADWEEEQVRIFRELAENYI